MSLADAYAPIEAKYRNEAISAAFGHLAPRPHRWYRMRVRFCESAFGQLCVLSYHTRLADSPWLYEGIHDFCNSYEKESGTVYEFDGKYRTNTDCSVHKFDGKVTAILQEEQA